MIILDTISVFKVKYTWSVLWLHAFQDFQSSETFTSLIVQSCCFIVSPKQVSLVCCGRRQSLFDLKISFPMWPTNPLQSTDVHSYATANGRVIQTVSTFVTLTPGILRVFLGDVGEVSEVFPSQISTSLQNDTEYVGRWQSFKYKQKTNS